jgi:hypothetical protein
MLYHGDTAKKREEQKQKALPCISPCRRGKWFSALFG